MGNFVIRDPLWLLALLAIPLVLWLRQRQRVSVLVVPFAAAWHRPSLAAAARWPMGLIVVGLTLAIGALARPQRVEDKREVRTQGYDIVLTVDLSGSMLAEDYEKAANASTACKRSRRSSRLSSMTGPTIASASWYLPDEPTRSRRSPSIMRGWPARWSD